MTNRLTGAIVFRIIAFTVLITAITPIGPHSEPSPVSGDAVVSELIRHAQTYYWYGMAERGNMRAFNRGETYLTAAELALERFTLEPARERLFSERIAALRSDIAEQADMAHDTFYGVFPLVRLLAPTVFSDASATGTFELVDDPDIIAVTNAGQNLVAGMMKWSRMPQLDVVFTSIPSHEPYENELLYLFNKHPKFYVHNAEEIVRNLTSDQRSDFYNGVISANVIQRFKQVINAEAVLVAVIRKLDIVDDNYFYLAEGHLYDLNNESRTFSFYTMGFSRDRNGTLPVIALWHIALFFAAVAAFVVMLRLRDDRWPPIGGTLAVTAAAFLFGRFLPWILNPLVAQIAPQPETLAKLSFWWPLASGAVIFLGPAGAFKMLSARFGGIMPIERRTGIVLAAVGLGVTAYLSTPVHLYTPETAFLIMLPLALTAGTMSFVAGRTLDRADPLPVHYLIVPALLLTVTGLAVNTLIPALMWAVALVALADVAYVHVKSRLIPDRTTDEEVAVEEPMPDSGSETPSTPDELIAASGAPAYQRFDAYADARVHVTPFTEGVSARCALAGPGGRGKTATALEVIRDLKKEMGGITVLTGECPSAMGNAYAPFQSALARHFHVNLLMPDANQMTHIDSALDGIFESVVPFAEILFPPSEEESMSASSEAEIFNAIGDTLHTLSKKQPVILFIEDAQWIDEASARLLSYLLERFTAGCAERILFLATGREEAGLVTAGFDGSIVTVGSPGKEQRIRILTDSLGIAQSAAEMVVDTVGSGSTDQGELFWLLHVVQDFARNGVLISSREGFRLAEKYRRGEPLPVPEELFSALRMQLKEYPQYRSILECAACLGLEFRAHILAESLDIPRLRVLHLLEEIEEETGIIYDVRENDDFFTFQSSFMLEVIRRNMKISGEGPGDTSVPQVIREYHARVGETLKRTSPAAVVDIAKHYYAAGHSRIGNALDYCLKAAHASVRMFDLNQARLFAGRARECADITGQTGTLEWEFLAIDCLEAHIGGINRVRAAERVLDYIGRHPDCGVDHLIVAARTCYDAGVESRDQRYFSEAARLGELIVSRTETPGGQAEGHHFTGISLPRDNRDDRERHLRTALSLVEPLTGEDRPERRLYARILNSIAEQLSVGDDADKKEAATLFERRLAVNDEWKLGDLPGQARSHGGRGRLALWGAPPDYTTALNHFNADLELSEKVGDEGGVTMMHSLIGQCHLGMARAGDDPPAHYERALHHYRSSEERSASPVSIFFAGAGIIESLCGLGLHDELEDAGTKLADIAGDNPDIGKPFAADLTRALETAARCTSSPWIDRLRIYCGS